MPPKSQWLDPDLIMPWTAFPPPRVAFINILPRVHIQPIPRFQPGIVEFNPRANQLLPNPPNALEPLPPLQIPPFPPPPFPPTHPFVPLLIPITTNRGFLIKDHYQAEPQKVPYAVPLDANGNPMQPEPKKKKRNSFDSNGFVPRQSLITVKAEKKKEKRKSSLPALSDWGQPDEFDDIIRQIESITMNGNTPLNSTNNPGIISPIEFPVVSAVPPPSPVQPFLHLQPSLANWQMCSNSPSSWFSINPPQFAYTATPCPTPVSRVA